jgi:hypothetical protein
VCWGVYSSIIDIIRPNAPLRPVAQAGAQSYTTSGNTTHCLPRTSTLTRRRSWSAGGLSAYGLVAIRETANGTTVSIAVPPSSILALNAGECRPKTIWNWGGGMGKGDRERQGLGAVATPT